MLIKKGKEIPSSETTDESVWRNRREFFKQISTVAGAAAISSILPACGTAAQPAPTPEPAAAPVLLGKYDTDEPKTPEKDVTTWNNYYEFGTGKDEPSRNSGKFKTSPWTVQVDGIKKPGKFNLADLLKGSNVEDRVYRMRCVEAWSMVIPWHGYPLADIIKRLEPAPQAKYVEFQTLLDPSQMPDQRYDTLHWPYTEGLRLDEAMNELAFFASGVYGKVGPNQNGE